MEVIDQNEVANGEWLDFVYDMYEIYHTEILENAFADMDSLIEGGKPTRQNFVIDCKKAIYAGVFMKGYIEERAVEIAYYIIENNATIRQTAKEFGNFNTCHCVCFCLNFK